MPCDSIQLCNVNLNLANFDILKEALKNYAERVYINEASKSISFSKNGISYTIANGKLTCPKGYESMADVVKQEYSKEVVKRAAVKFGWNVKQTKNNKFQLARRF